MQTVQSPALSEFVKAGVNLPLYRLPAHLASFPKRWPFPRGDLYHWIPLLNRFDTVLEQLIEEYGLSSGPQTKPFGSVLLGKSVVEDKQDASIEEELARESLAHEGDRTLLEMVLEFSRLLMENCGNRNLYSSSDRCDHLLNTTSLSVLEVTLRLGVRLAQRYHASRSRGAHNSPQFQQSLLQSHYNINLEKVQRLAVPFQKPPVKASISSTPAATPSSKGKEKQLSRLPQGAVANPNDLVSLSKDSADTSWDDYRTVRMNFYPSAPQESKKATAAVDGAAPPSTPPTPTPSRRSAGVGSSHQSNRPSRLSSSEEVPSTPPSPTVEKTEASSTAGVRTIEHTSSNISSTTIEQLLSEAPEDLSKEGRYELLQKLRVAHGLSTPELRQKLLSIRMLAVTNVAYVHGEATFQQKILSPDSEEPKRLQLAYQLAELIHPEQSGTSKTPRYLQTLALGALEALTKHKSRAPDVAAALNINVGHGVLLYVTRKAASDMEVEDNEESHDLEGDEWREALFSLISSLAGSANRTAETLVSAGLLQTLADMLKLRTNKAERFHHRILSFLDTFVHGVRDALTVLANAKGLDIIADLIDYEVQSTYKKVQDGEGIPEEYRSQMVDFQIPFYQQQTLRWLFKFVNHMMQIGGGNIDRLLRNLIDSPQLLGALKMVLSHARVYGSNVWSGAVNILSSFIHNEPTSYGIIAEAGLSKAFLEAVTLQDLTEIDRAARNSDSATTDDAIMALPPSLEVNGAGSDRPADAEGYVSKDPSGRSIMTEPRSTSLKSGIIPSTEAISNTPVAIGAICLNSAGLKLIQQSNVLSKFFEIFESQEHVKCMQNDPVTLRTLGSVFDELVRHHPALKNNVMNSVLNMVSNVARLCKSRAWKEGSGSKLWIDQESGTPTVSGGFAALAQLPGGVSPETVDLPDGSRLVDRPATPGNVNDVVDEKNGLAVTDYIHSVMKFLSGFFENHTMCNEFIEKGATYLVLDYATLPSLPYDFNNTHACRELSHVIHMLTECKPHMVLPSLLLRTQTAVNKLSTLAEHQKEWAFFGFFTDRDRKESHLLSGYDRETLESKGTDIIKALTQVNCLAKVLQEVYSPPIYHMRGHQQVSPFIQVNLADIYTDVVRKLGQIQGACLWEEVLLQKTVPEAWKDLLRKKSPSFGNDLLDELPGMLPDEAVDGEDATPAENNGRSGTESNNASNTVSNTNSESKRRKSAAAKDENTAYFKNTQTLRYILFAVPATINSFFRCLAKGLLSKRRPDTYQRQNASKVADAIAEASLQQLRLPKVRNASLKDRFNYYLVDLTSLSRLMVERTADGATLQVLTIILYSFKKVGGIEYMREIAEDFIVEARRSRLEKQKDPSSLEAEALQNRANTGINIVLTFFSQISRAKSVVEASQSHIMMSERERDRLDQFVPSQFLLELRMAVVPLIRSMWESEFVDEAQTSTAKVLIEVLRSILDSDPERGAYRRTDPFPPRVGVSSRTFGFHHDRINHLVNDLHVDRELAREAVYRCNNNLMWSEEYCRAFERQRGGQRLPVPSTEDPSSPSRSRGSLGREASDNNAPRPGSSETIMDVSNQSTVNPPSVEVAEADVESGTGNPTSPPPSAPGAPQGLSDTMAMSIDNLLNGIDNAEAQLRSTSATSSTPTRPVEAQDRQAVVTIEDLDEERSKIRENLIERSLDILNGHTEVTFELAELIGAAAKKASDSYNYRKEIGETLVQSLISLQMEDDFRPAGKKVAAYANLLGLVLQDEELYSATLDELKDSFATLLGFIKIFPSASEQPTEESSPWIGQVLLILEKLLADDAQPEKITWTPDDEDTPTPSPPGSPAFREVVVPEDEKIQLFDSIVEILPKIGKDQSLALSVTRALVMLTRNRNIAKRLAEKRNMQRLFVMVKQLSGATSSKLQNAFMAILRHVIEDDEIIRQVMKSEIIANVSQQRGRHIDTTNYVKNLHHLALRNVDLFVEVTNEVCKIRSYEVHRGPQFLILRSDVKPPHPDEAGEVSDEMATEEKGPNDSTEDIKISTEGDEKEALDKTKSTDIRAPVVERPDGVIHYLLSELLSYKDVEDKPQPTLSKEKSKESQIEAQSESTLNRSSSATSTEATGETSDASVKPEKEEFTSDQHPIFIYRCFLLQCLTELLSSYTRTKIEFINFSRKADPQVMTPSKPRSGVLNYLLNAVIPAGSIEEDQSVTYGKKRATSQWAMSAIVSLCSKTGERKVIANRTKPMESDEEPDLLFIRKFVLEHALKAYKDANSSTESPDSKYARMLSIAELFDKILMDRPVHDRNTDSNIDPRHESPTPSQRELSKIMFEKGFIAALTSSVADIDLNFPGSKKVVKYILRPLNKLTQTAIYLSENSSISSTPGQTDEDEISSATSVSDIDDEREETPDLFRHSTLGMLDPSGREEESSSASEDDDDEEMYDDEYDEEMDYEEEMPGEHGEVISDEEDEMEGSEGPIEGLPGDVGMDVELVIDDPEDLDDDDDDDDEDGDSDDDDLEDLEGDDDEGIEVPEEITGDDENASMADDNDWEDEDEGADIEDMAHGGMLEEGPEDPREDSMPPYSDIYQIMGDDGEPVDPRDLGMPDVGDLGMGIGMGHGEYLDEMDDEEGEFSLFLFNATANNNR